MNRTAHVALGILIGAALDREDVRRISSVFYAEKDIVVVLESAAPGFDDSTMVFRPKDVADMKKSDLDEWADALVDVTMVGDDDEDEDD